MSWALGLIPKTEHKTTPKCSHTALGSLSGLNLHFYSITTGFPAGVLEGGSCLPVFCFCCIPGATYSTYPLAPFLMSSPPGISEPATQACCRLLRFAVLSPQGLSVCFSPCLTCSSSGLCLTSPCSFFRSQLTCHFLQEAFRQGPGLGPGGSPSPCISPLYFKHFLTYLCRRK